MIKNIMKCALVCMGLIFSLYGMEEREDGSKSTNSSGINVDDDILMQLDKAVIDNDSCKASNVMQRLFAIAGFNYGVRSSLEKCKVFVALLNKSSEIDEFSNKTRDSLSRQLIEDYCLLEEKDAEQIKKELTLIIDHLIKLKAMQTLGNLVSIFAPNKLKKEEPSIEYRKICKALEKDMSLRGQVPVEIQDAIAYAREKNHFKNLLELKKQEGIVGTPYEQLLEQIIVELMGGLYPVPSLKEVCLEERASFLGKLAKEKKFEEIENILAQLNDDLRAQLINMRIDGEGNTLLHHYVAASDFAGCRRLLLWGANPRICNLDNLSVPHLAELQRLGYNKKPVNSACSSLKDSCLKRAINIFGSMVAQKQWQSIELKIEQLPKDLRIKIINMAIPNGKKSRIGTQNILEELLYEHSRSSWGIRIAPSVPYVRDVDEDHELYQAIYEDNIEVIPNMIDSLKSRENGVKIIQSCLNFAIDFSKNWNVICLLKDAVNISEKELFHKAINAGNLFLVKKCILQGVTLDVDSHFVSSIIIGNRIDKAIFPLLISAGLKVNKIANIHSNVYRSLLHFFADAGRVKDLSILKNIKKAGHVFDLTITNEAGLTPLEQTLISRGNPKFTCWLMDEATEQKIDIKELLNHLIKGTHNIVLGTKTLHDALRGTISFFIKFKIANKYSIRCIKKFLELDPSLKNESSDDKSFLTRILQDPYLSQNQELIALFK